MTRDTVTSMSNSNTRTENRSPVEIMGVTVDASVIAERRKPVGRTGYEWDIKLVISNNWYTPESSNVTRDAFLVNRSEIRGTAYLNYFADVTRFSGAGGFYMKRVDDMKMTDNQMSKLYGELVGWANSEEGKTFFEDRILTAKDEWFSQEIARKVDEMDRMNEELYALRNDAYDLHKTQEAN